jgi:phosphocarrier protein HPr
MPSQEIEIINKLGLHARASAKLTQTASRFPCDVSISRGSRTVNAKSIMGVMTLAASRGSQVTISAEGQQAEEALSAIVALVADKFGEGE